MRNRLTLALFAVTIVGALAATGVAVAAAASPTPTEAEPTVTVTLDPYPTATVDPTPTTTDPPQECVADPTADPDPTTVIVPAAFAPAGDFEIDTAVVCKEGKLIRGTAKKAEKLGNTTVYKVEFKRNVDQCTWLATLAGHKAGVLPGAGEIVVYQEQADPKAVVRVITMNSAGAGKPNDFHLAVICPKS